MEEPVQFTCNNKRLYGILHVPDTRVTPSTIVIIVTGGPQVRIGAHRLYVQLSRFLSERNIASFRFDYEGMGDSEGNFVGFRYAEASIDAAIMYLQQRFTSNLNFLLWSLCDGATASVLYAANHPESASGLILCNPLVLTTQSLARSTIRHYYGNRIFNRDFLHKLVHFKVNLKETFKSLWMHFYDAHIRMHAKSDEPDAEAGKLPDIVFETLGSFEKPIRIILSTDDIVASNFQDELRKNKRLRKAYNKNNITSHIIKNADHTFTDPAAMKELFAITLQMIHELTSSVTEKRRS